MRTPLPTFLALVSALPLAAQQPIVAPNPNLERMTNGTYSRSHDYDLVHQRIALRDFNWDSTSFVGQVATTLVSRRAGLDSLILDAGGGLSIRSATAASGAALRTSHTRDTLVVYLPKPVGAGDTVRFTLDYDAHIKSGSGLTFIDQRPHTPRQLWSQGEDMNNHDWFPTYDFPNDKMTWEVDATVPAGYLAVSNGALTEETPGPGGTHTFHWNESRPSATYLVSLIVEPLAEVKDSWHDVPVDYYVYHADSALAWRLFHVTPDMIDVYSKLTGIPYPWQKYAQTTVADFFGGMENVSATTLVDWLPDSKAYADRPWYQYILIPHELAHQWFGDYVTTENWANTWLNEGFAEFMPGQYWKEKSGAHLEQDYYADEYRQFMGIEARRPMPLASMGSNNIYPKGALVLEMLEDYLGPQRFWAAAHRYLTDHAFGVATTDDLLKSFEASTGEKLDWFWREWMYSTGYPAFTVTSSYDAAAHTLTLVAAQTQRDSLKADSTGMRYVIPEAFTMPVTIRVGTAAGDVVKKAQIAERVDTIVVGGVASAPTMVVFDDGNHILKSLDFDQPTAWLANQLQHDPNLWDREWVLAELAHRPGDAAAAAAVANAATSADYFETRMLAASALSAFPADVAIPALTRALADTSAQVRAAAAAELGKVHDARAAELAHKAWNSDTSYSVRAAALGAIAQLDPAGRAAVIATGLSTPSYRDDIQNAALVAIARSNDTTFVAAVQALVGDQPLPARVLGAFAARGNSHALGLLTADLDDSRAWVRQWTLQALSGLPVAQRLSVLHAAEPKLTHADTRAAVERLIAALEARR
ncbi:MAG TPA: M1 family aminopeptidase [Gemmatimonadaceae bacterium]|nr:M1 family aminopeptidase [Gemmatimonadaceae bacterium]